jgi:hypothetical protein
VLVIDGPELVPGTRVQRPEQDVMWRFFDRRIEGVTFRGIRDGAKWLSFRHTEFVDCTFERCDLRWSWGGHHEHQDWGPRFVGCRFDRCDLNNTEFPYGRIEGCTFDSCRWKTHLRSVDLVDNVFLGVVDSLTIWGRHSQLLATMRSKDQPNVITGNNFSAADLRGLGLRGGMPVLDQQWPTGPGCAIVDRIPERVALIEARAEARADPVDQELLDSVRWWRYWRSPGTEQDIAWLRWDDPAMTEESNRFYRALAEVRLV